MKRRNKLVFAAGILMSVLFTQGHASADTAYLKTNVNLRSAPSLTSSIVRVLPKGTTHQIVSKQGDFYYLGANQWITADASYVSVSEDAALGTAYLKTNVNLRGGPSWSAAVVRVLPKGTTHKVVSKQGDWYYLGYNQWITADPAYVSLETTSSGSQPAPAPAPEPVPNSNNVLAFAQRFIGVPYVFGGQTPRGFDCSGFLFYVLKNNGYQVSRNTAAGYWNQWTPVSNPQPGDVVFFKNTYKAGISHAGFYLGNGKMIHAGDNGITISNLSSSYYQKHFAGYRRP